MAKVIATVGGIALKPGVSLNRRWYTPEMIAAAVKATQARIESGRPVSIVDRTESKQDSQPAEPVSQLTHHEAGDDSTRIVGRLTSVKLTADGSARFTADIADTKHGQAIASLLDTSDGQPAFLKGVSIRGYWKGTVRKVDGPDGKPAETADGIDLDGLDYTRSPGVPGAEVDTFAWADRSGRSETTERVAITESVQEAQVTVITEETTTEAAPVPDGVRETLGALFPAPLHVLEDGICVTCAEAETAEASVPMGKRGKGLSGAGKVWADPGYQADGKQRYDVSTKDNAKAAWSYINQKDNAAKYSANQLKRVKGRILKALKKFGVSTSSEARGWMFEEPQAVGESVLEWMSPAEDAERSGSWSISACNGPVNLYLSSYCMDPADLRAILTAAAKAAGDTLCALDPDMDGDVDVPGVGDNSDTDDDAGECDPDGGGDVTETGGTGQTESHGNPAASPAAETQEGEPAVSGATTTQAGQAPAAGGGAPAGIDPELYAKLVAKETRRLAKKAAREAAAAGSAGAAPAAETASAANPPAAQPAPAAGAPAQETEEQRRARLAALVDQQVAAAAAREGLASEKTDEQIIAEMVEERMVPLRQAAAEGGRVARKGLDGTKTLEDAVLGDPKMLREGSNSDLALTAAAAFGPKGSRG
jgi:hypothetical protein